MFDKAGKAYWDSSWEHGSVAAPVDPSRGGLRNYVNRRYHEQFAALFGRGTRAAHGALDQPLRLLEVGCANSAWLPYFAREFGFKIVGLDYSEIGCAQERRVLKDARVEGDIVCADLFEPPPAMLASFDALITFGVVEHFTDTSRVIRALSAFLKPGAVLFTMIPNLAGSLGVVQRAINKPVYDIHVPLDREALAAAHAAAGLRVEACEYFLATGFDVCNLNGIPMNSAKSYLKKIVLAGLTRLSMAVWWCERATGYWPARRTFAPYIHCIARRVEQP